MVILVVRGFLAFNRWIMFCIASHLCFGVNGHLGGAPRSRMHFQFWRVRVGCVLVASDSPSSSLNAPTISHQLHLPAPHLLHPRCPRAIPTPIIQTTTAGPPVRTTSPARRHPIRPRLLLRYPSTARLRERRRRQLPAVVCCAHAPGGDTQASIGCRFRTRAHPLDAACGERGTVVGRGRGAGPGYGEAGDAAHACEDDEQCVHRPYGSRVVRPRWELDGGACTLDRRFFVHHWLTGVFIHQTHISLKPRRSP